MACARQPRDHAENEAGRRHRHKDRADEPLERVEPKADSGPSVLMRASPAGCARLTYLGPGCRH